MAHIEWAVARYTVVDSTAQPGSFENNGDENSVAAVRFTYGSDGDALVIEGPPEDLLVLLENAAIQVRGVLRETILDPALRSLYGVSDMSEVFADQEEADRG